MRSLSDVEWFAGISDLGKAEGECHRLGHSHAALFLDRGPTLIVTFESSDEIANRHPDSLPVGFDLAKERKWSHLCLLARSDTWFRDKTVYAYFDQLVDAAFFEEFDQVVFYGAGMAGYAAAAYSATAPGATVILAAPQATLDPRITGWDPRFTEFRRLCFTDRYGYAPEMTEGAGDVYVIFDPEQNLDAMHAALFARAHVTLLPCRNLGRDIGRALEEMRIIRAILSAIGAGEFDATRFRTIYRARRNYIPYLQNLLARLDRDGRPYLAALLCRSVAERLNVPAFAMRLARLRQDLEAQGRKLPSRRR
ncbi:phosphoadenosine phosphosulfate reductase [Defluviimonas sp. WL0024]|uniref:Phosphoadenosine phosphosulfate reductase n=1 Tax=Albidovulum salinarum TaxID=2984153 RepID=A0ABT2X022_9RHOB|nr:phosphoadenosine phosphosulfate reductase [Defluviimonas sp. WL0024]MCU9847069.1 phosphoadenosine phosphosulfate reductase [Defluviimonas sp. WL0024]